MSAPLICPCGCGQTSDQWSPPVTEYVADMVDRLGPTVLVLTDAGAWWVPRVYIAMHGIEAGELARLAERHGWALDP